MDSALDNTRIIVYNGTNTQTFPAYNVSEENKYSAGDEISAAYPMRRGWRIGSMQSRKVYLNRHNNLLSLEEHIYELVDVK